jgi:DNA polymerase III delta prime subunit
LFFCQVDCKTLELPRLWIKLNGFVNHEEKSLPVPYRIIFIDNVDEMPPSGQQILKKIMEKNAEVIKFFFTCTTPSKLTGFISNHAFVLQTHPIREKDAVELVLKICRTEKIGFERDGIQEIFLGNVDVSFHL